MIHRIIAYSVNNRVVILIFTMILIGTGVLFLGQLPMDVYPDLNAPIVNVVTESPGMAPGDIETLITFPMESSFNSLPYVKRVRSNSTLGLSKITVEFEYGTDIYFARQLVTEKLQMITPTLPDGIDPPFIGPISSMFADAIEFTIRGGDLYAIRDFTEWELKPRLQTVPGVSAVVPMGGFLKQYHVLLDPDRMLNHGIRIPDIMQALRQNNRNASGGFIVQGPEEKMIRGIGRIRTEEDIRDIVLKTENGIPITVRQVAEVRIGPFVRRGTAGESGREVVLVTVQNQYNANVMKTIRGVEAVLDEVRADLPEGWMIEPFYNQLDMINKSIRNVTSAILIGAILVVFSLYLFLNHIKSTVVVAMAIPLSAVFAFVFFRIFGLTVNIMTLGGLAIGLGMIVDSSIIMVENIYRHVQEGKASFREALLAGAKEVGNPIFYAILILLAVFAPIFTLQGIEGRMFIPLTFAVSAAVLGSLLISLTLTPVLASYVFRSASFRKGEGLILPLLRKAYHPVLVYALKHARVLIVICLMFIGMGVGLVFLVGSEFMPEMDESSLLVDVLLPPETSLEESSRIASRIAMRITEIPEVLRVVGATGKARGAEHTAPVNLTHSNCILVPKEDRRSSIEEIKEEIRRVTRDIPGVHIQINAPLQHRISHVITGIRSAVAVKIFGENINTISSLSDRVYEIMATVRGVTDLQIEQVSGVPQLQLKFDRGRLATYGLNVNDVSEVVEVALNGKTATELIETQRRYDVFVRYQEAFRNDIEKVENLLIETPAGLLIPIGELASVVEDRNPAVIRRENALRRGLVQCNVSGRDVGSVVGEIKARLALLDLPDRYFLTYGGTYENQLRAMRQLGIVVALTIVIVFSLLIVSFRSVKHALLIIINIPLALTGGLIILVITGQTLSVPSIVGFIALIGIAVQDGIVLVNHINGYRRQGLSVAEAIIRGGNNKLRPVLMTTFTTMLGLVPLALRNVTGSEIQKPLAFVIMFGLLFSTVLTLVVLPSLYSVLEKDGKR